MRILVEKPEQRRLLVMLRHRWEDNIMGVHRELGCEDVGGFICPRIGSSNHLI
jgi:hypothetical protein